MSIWSTSTGRNSVFGAEDGAVLPSSHLPIHVARTHLRNIDGHCFHKRFHECQVGSSPLVSLILQFVSFLSFRISYYILYCCLIIFFCRTSYTFLYSRFLLVINFSFIFSFFLIKIIKIHIWILDHFDLFFNIMDININNVSLVYIFKK